MSIGKQFWSNNRNFAAVEVEHSKAANEYNNGQAEKLTLIANRNWDAELCQVSEDSCAPYLIVFDKLTLPQFLMTRDFSGGLGKID